MGLLLMTLGFLFLSKAHALPIQRNGLPDQRIISRNDAKEHENMEGTVTHKRFLQFTDKQLHEIQNIMDLLLNWGHNVRTDSMMDEARCGVPDVAGYAVIRKNLKWKSTIITYRIVNYTPDLPPADVDRSIREALRVWSEVTPLQFIQLHGGHADLMISFVAREHGDFFSFDGPRRVLAHAFPPGDHLGGDVHFDEEETWTVDSEDYNLFSVAVHEFGHALGLTHSSNHYALMYPIYNYFNSENFTLPADDVLGIQELYGSRPSSVITPAICTQEVPIDAIAHWEGGIIIFKDRHVWYHHPNVFAHTAILTSSLLEKVPDFIDTAYNYPVKNSILIFKGRQFWSVNGSNLKVEEPGDIGLFGFPESVMRIDAAFHDGEKEKTFFFTGDLCWSYNEQQGQMNAGFPLSLESQFPGVGNKVDAAYMNVNGNILFYRGETQIEYDPRSHHVTKVIESFSVLC
ncbi:collagenase 3-like [Anomaloglossus baeobatrachus]|uniref:collagenase 3-like n=1 Tax=Anomaloglossus baeobatrachus TaxID=238106 RepID=UPI003F50B892